MRLKNYFPFIPFIGILLVLIIPNEETGITNDIILWASAGVQGLSIGLLMINVLN